MLKKLLNLMINFGRYSANTNCIGVVYQPSLPEDLKK